MSGLFFWCQDPGSNWGPFPLQGNALPTELSWHTKSYLFKSLKLSKTEPKFPKPSLAPPYTPARVSIYG